MEGRRPWCEADDRLEGVIGFRASSPLMEEARKDSLENGRVA
jgi:hypothetical protein